VKNFLANIQQTISQWAASTQQIFTEVDNPPEMPGVSPELGARIRQDRRSQL
jgi:hypothetical protein